MSTTYNQTNNAAACSPAAGFNTDATKGASLGSTEQTAAVGKTSTNTFAVVVSDILDGTEDLNGSYSCGINVTTAHADFVFTNISIALYDGCTPSQTLATGSASANPNTTGVKTLSFTVSGKSFGAETNPRLVVLYTVSNTGHSNATFGATPDQTLVAPFSTVIIYSRTLTEPVDVVDQQMRAALWLRPLLQAVDISDALIKSIFPGQYYQQTDDAAACATGANIEIGGKLDGTPGTTELTANVTAGGGLAVVWMVFEDFIPDGMSYDGDYEVTINVTTTDPDLRINPSGSHPFTIREYDECVFDSMIVSRTDPVTGGYLDADVGTVGLKTFNSANTVSDSFSGSTARLEVRFVVENTGASDHTFGITPDGYLWAPWQSGPTQIYVRNLTEALEITDEQLRAALLNRSLADSASITDALLRAISGGLTFERTLTEALEITDLEQRVRYLFRAVADSVPLANFLRRFVDYSRGLGDSAALADQMLRGGLLFRKIGDTISLADFLNSILERVTVRFLVESVGVQDATQREALLYRQLADAQSLVDTLVRAGYLVRGLQDSAVLTDFLQSIVERLKERALSDSIGLYDAMAREVLAFRVLVDTSALSDALARARAFTRGLRDEVTISDSLLSEMAGLVFRILQDSLGIEDAQTRAVWAERMLFDAAAVADTARRSALMFRLLADSPAITDGLSRWISEAALIVERFLADNIGLVDSAEQSRELSRLLASAFLLLDNLKRDASFSRLLTESLEIRDALARSLVLIIIRRLADGVTLSDTLLRTFIGGLQDIGYIRQILAALAVEQAMTDGEAVQNIVDGTTIEQSIARPDQ